MKNKGKTDTLYKRRNKREKRKKEDKRVKSKEQGAKKEMRKERRAKKWKIQEKRAFFLAFFFFLSSFSFCMAQTADDLGSAATRAETARKRAGDFEAGAYFPSEWETAESQYAKAGLLPRDTGDDADKTAAAYNEAAAAFDRLFELAVPLYAQAREDEIMAIRGYLITLGAKNPFHEYLMNADITALLANTLYEAKDYYPARDSAAQALQKFNVLETAFNAWLLREEIRERGFAGYDPENFELGEEILSGAMDAYMADDLAGAQEKAEEALSKYNMVIAGITTLEKKRIAAAAIRNANEKIPESDRIARDNY